tara:strand:+ start:5193 stop:5927 length:735 start_codon:yes stop_codon:yes gene_type:complete
MGHGLDILLLAGSAEARQIAQHLVAQGHRVRAWLSEPPRGTSPMAVPFDMQRFDDPAQVAADMARFDAVIDASHGFDGTMSAAGFAAAQLRGLPFVTYARPGWPIDDPLLRAVPDVAAAARAVRPGVRVFCATGWTSLPAFTPFRGARLLLRQTSHHNRPAPYDFVDLVFGDPPFTQKGEEVLFRGLQVDQLICRNLGGEASRPKVDAALALGIDVILIDRPALPQGAAQVWRITDVFDWVAHL